MKRKFNKILKTLIVIMAMGIFFTVTASAVSLDYSGGSASNSTGAGATTSGFQIRWDETNKNLVGYRFSVVLSGGTPKSGTKPINVYLVNSSDGNKAYSSVQKFIISSGVFANKKQLANGTKVSSIKTTQSGEYKSDGCGFYSAPPLNPTSVGDWIKNASSNYLNLQRIYALCGTSLSNATESDYVLIEPIFAANLAGVTTAATPTELALYGAAVSGGDQYNGANGKLYNAGSGTLWNLCNYVNREFPNALYVSSNTGVYSAVTTKSSGRYTYKDIIGKGYGCSVLTVKNYITLNKVHIAYHPNGGTVTKVGLNDYGFVVMDGATYFHTLKHNEKDDPYNASTFGMTREGYDFVGWEVKSTKQVLDQDTTYASTVFAHLDDKNKTTANTATVYCQVFAVWEKNSYTNTINHWAWGFGGNGNNRNKEAFHLKDTTYTKNIGEKFKLTKDNAITPPNGFYVENDFGSSYMTGSWADYPFGTEITQKASAMSAEYDYQPINYSITYDLDGGTNNSNNPTSYNVLYGKNLYAPTKEGHEFIGWMQEVTNNRISLSAINHNYNYYSVLYGIKPGVEYNVWVGSANVTSGSSTQFSSIIFDFTDNKMLTSTVLSFGSNISYKLTCPSNANASHDIRILIYSGVMGSTWDIATSYSNVKICFMTDGINKGCGSAFSSPDSLYSELAKRTTGDIKLIAKWELLEKIVIVPIEPNAPYREKTDVMGSFWLVNISDEDYTPTKGAKVAFSVFNSENEKIAEETQNFVAPKNDKNLAYISWYVPDEYADTNVTVKAHIIDGEYEYGHIENTYEITSFDICTTPNTSYKDKAPEDFSVPNSTFDNEAKARWWQWEYSNGSFVKKEYAVSNKADNVLLTVPKSPSAYFEGGKLNLKSGYGFGCNFVPAMLTVDGYESGSADKCVIPQYFYALFPEYNYEYGIDKCRSFENVSGKKEFVNSPEMLKQHFTPIYYPDGNYDFQVVLSDCWTPSGMLTSYKTVTIKIQGNMYEDWYVGRR